MKTNDKKVKEWFDNLKNVEVVCGGLMSGERFIGGCGKPINILKVYACVDCSAPFHRKCLLRHFKEDMPEDSLTKLPLEEAFKKIDEMSNQNNHDH